MNKKVFCFVLLLIIAMLVSCQQTPSEAVVVNKKDSMLEKQLQSSIAPKRCYEAPSEWLDTMKSNDGGISININANIEYPKVDEFPIIEVIKDEITQECANTMLSVLTQGKPFMMNQDNLPLTKSEVQDMIVQLKQYLSDPNSDLNIYLKGQEGYNEAVLQTEKQISSLEEALPDASDTNEIKEIGFEFQKDALANELYIDGEVQLDKKTPANIQIFKPYQGGGGTVIYSNLDDGLSYPTVYSSNVSNLNNLNISIEDAKSIADAFLTSLGIEGYDASLTCSGYMPDERLNSNDTNAYLEFPQCYVFYYTKTIQGINITYRDISEDIAALRNGGQEVPMQYAEYWPQEYIEILVRDSGVNYMKWTMPVKQTQVLKTNVVLLPFEKIQEIFNKQIFIEGSWNDAYDTSIISRDININRVVLGMMQIREKDNIDRMILVPAWMFFGNETFSYSSSQTGGYPLDENNQFVNDRIPGHSYMCINAVDGSIINPFVGY